VTASDGGVYVVDTSIAVEAAMDTAKQVLEHELEAWTLVFSHDGKAIYSGGDDASLRFSTLQSTTPSTSTSTSDSQEQEAEGDEEEEDDFTPIQWQDRRSHQAGVTAILPLATEENILITGSYDDNIRVLHTPLIGRKQILAEENLEGGVWRLKMLKEESEHKRYVISPFPHPSPCHFSSLSFAHQQVTKSDNSILDIRFWQVACMQELESCVFKKMIKATGV
jgi:diphthamide biosynthesis protein 7